jgi:hypothetical protein
MHCCRNQCYFSAPDRGHTAPLQAQDRIAREGGCEPCKRSYQDKDPWSRREQAGMRGYRSGTAMC